VVPITCPNCRNDVFLHYYISSRWFSLFFQPVFPYKRRHLLLCPICGRGAEMSREQRATARHLVAYTASFHASSEEGKEHYAELAAEFLKSLALPVPLSESPKPRLEPSMPGWYADPSGRHQLRYWDAGWTEHVSTSGVRGIDPPGTAN
jgi:hypothetical protein